MPYQEITRQIIGACYEISNELGHGYMESVYEKALLIALTERGLSAVAQQVLPVRFRGQVIGQFYADLVVENFIIVELKVVSNILPEHLAQAIHYLKSSELPVGLVANFGKPRVQIKRVYWEEELKELLKDPDSYLAGRQIRMNLRSK